MVGRRLAIVTGGGRGIGFAIAERLGNDGLQVLIWESDGESASRARSELERARVPAASRQVDVSDATAVRFAAQEAIAEFGGVDVLVTSAGWNKRSRFLESDEGDWDRIIGINYGGVLTTCRYLATSISEAPHGRIVNIASDLAKLGGTLEAVYSGVHAAVVSFSRALAHELASSRTTVNVVCFGATDTPHDGGIEAERDTDLRFSHVFAGRSGTAELHGIPLGRLGRPEDIAAAVSFLVRPESEFITGQVLSVSGGQTMY